MAGGGGYPTAVGTGSIPCRNRVSLRRLGALGVGPRTLHHDDFGIDRGVFNGCYCASTQEMPSFIAHPHQGLKAPRLLWSSWLAELAVELDLKRTKR